MNMTDGRTAPVLDVRDLHVSYGHLHAVDGISLQMDPGEIVAVIGPNGAGKTSFAESIEGLRRPRSGTVRVFGLDPIAHRREVYEKLGVQLQQTGYPRRIRTAELCELFAAFYENPADWEKMLLRLDLAKRARHDVQRLSGGERQRLSILLALIGRPELLIADELTTGLDPEARQIMLRCFQEIREDGTAILMVSHYLDEVDALADRLLYMERGKARFLGTKDAFRAWARSRIPAHRWHEDLSLEGLYLALAVPEGPTERRSFYD